MLLCDLSVFLKKEEEGKLFGLLVLGISKRILFFSQKLITIKILINISYYFHTFIYMLFIFFFH